MDPHTEESNGRRLLPPMGWNSWNSGVVLSDAVIRRTVDAMVDSGLRDAGYRYVTLDAGWAAPTRSPSGELQAHPGRFPHGIGALSQYVHDRGMLLGIYASPFNQTCGQAIATASAGRERTDVRTLAAWGVDLLKYDWCRRDANHREQIDAFSAMRDAIRDDDCTGGRRIVYSINPNSSDDPRAGTEHDWSDIADMVRITGDLVPVWDPRASDAEGFDFFAHGIFVGVEAQFTAAMAAAARPRPGFWPDPDMLVVGSRWSSFFADMQHNVIEMLGGKPELAQMHSEGDDSHSLPGGLGPDGQPSHPDLTEAEEQAHFSLWAMLAAPLVTGVDVTTMTDRTRRILTNPDVIAVDQDPLVRRADALPDDPRVLIKPLADRSVVVALFNGDSRPASMEIPLDRLGLPPSPSYRIRDLWRHTEQTAVHRLGPELVPPHGVSVFRITG